MRSSTILFKLIILVLGVNFFSCSKESDLGSSGDGQFYRMESLDIGVTAKHRQVKVLFQVRNFDYKGIGNLTVNNLEVYENDGRIDSEGDLTITRDSIPFNLKTVLLLDLTRSVEGLVGQIKSASIALINQKLPEQEIAIYIFDASTRMLLDFSDDKNELIQAVNSISETDLVNSTNLYGAVIDIADLWTDSYSTNSITDGSVIIFTDGRHNATPNITLTDAMSALGDKKRYVAALNSPDLDEESLKVLAGGTDRYFKAADINALESMFLNIQAEIKNLSNSIYYMYYQSPITDPTPFENDLRIEIKNNTNKGLDRSIRETFNSEGFGV